MRISDLSSDVCSSDLQMPEGVWLGTRYWYGAHDNELNKKFVAAYQKSYGTPPSYNAEGAYVAVHAYKAAIEKAGKVDGKAIAQALSGLSIPAPTGTLVLRKGDNQALIGPDRKSTRLNSSH